jgi:hypothetical protein
MTDAQAARMRSATSWTAFRQTSARSTARASRLADTAMRPSSMGAEAARKIRFEVLSSPAPDGDVLERLRGLLPTRPLHQGGFGGGRLLGSRDGACGRLGRRAVSRLAASARFCYSPKRSSSPCHFGMPLNVPS